MKNLEEIVIQNLEPYNSIYNYLRFTVLPKYPCLTSVFLDNLDEEGNPKIQYYIRYSADLSLRQWHELCFKIEKDVFDFCISSGVDEEIFDEIDFIVTVDGEYYEKYRKGF